MYIHYRKDSIAESLRRITRGPQNPKTPKPQNPDFSNFCYWVEEL